jgi:large subunit ribosomal protein L30
MTKKKTVKVKLVRSPIGTAKSRTAPPCVAWACASSTASELEDTPAVRGMINKISYLVKVL